eukprot:CAMPEP_0118945850 /NCGR_PEP_ID=MMETSP1169-20130426/43096_1 /TAXON_ID=36882 /ORGANISM="Pyramimonas obovata, Strain CCMP722" /LENGTH=421 /DNA_ID=CAMNT_0006891661 /DNA_START=123 /DNA_END=1388 /DNA_ORIENTATION=-
MVYKPTVSGLARPWHSIRFAPTRAQSHKCMHGLQRRVSSRTGEKGVIIHTHARGVQQGRRVVVQATSSGVEATTSRSLVPRRVEKVEKFARLPVWPVVPGVIFIILDLLRLNELAAFLEHRFGGRVCPMMFTPEQTDPFVLCVHHRHSFWWWDPVRPIFRLLLPEGFPAHPHRGFETVTYMLSGGFRHRDSTGVQQYYGEGCVQWMTAGRGILHEEMWESDIDTHELYQIWVNLPAKDKMCAPRIQMLGEDTDAEGKLGAIPEHAEGGVRVKVVSGEFEGVRSPVATHSPVTLLHVTVQSGATFKMELPAGDTCMLYCRKGAAVVGGQEVPTFATAFLERSGEVLVVQNEKQAELDFMLLSGTPLREPIQSQGSMVMNNSMEIEMAYRDYQMGKFGFPWDHSLTNEEWLQHVEKHRPSMMK